MRTRCVPRRRGGIEISPEAGFEQVAAADLVVLAAPVAATAPLLTHLGPHLARTRLVTDVGSTKRGAIAAAEAAGLGRVFVGSHPLAGSHASGWGAARTALFAGARLYLCRTRDTEPSAAVLAEELWESVGALPEWIDAAEHDRQLACTSYLPQTLATALALALDARGIARDDLGPGGRDMTRLAGSSAEMWTGILLENADTLLPALAGFAKATAALQAAIHAGDHDAIGRLFSRAKRWTTPSAPDERLPPAYGCSTHGHVLSWATCGDRPNGGEGHRLIVNE